MQGSAFVVLSAMRHGIAIEGLKTKDCKMGIYLYSFFGNLLKSLMQFCVLRGNKQTKRTMPQESRDKGQRALINYALQTAGKIPVQMSFCVA